MTNVTKQLNLQNGIVYARQPPLINTAGTTYSINASTASNPRLKSATAYLNLTDYTIEFFILTNATTLGTILSIRDSTSNINNIMLNVLINRNNDGRLSLETWDGITNITSRVTSSNPINDGNIHHIAITFNSATKQLTLIVDGILNNVISQNGTIPTNACYLYVFNDNETNNNSMGMIIDDLVIFPYVVPSDSLLFHTSLSFNENYYGFLEKSVSSGNITLSNNNLTATSTNTTGMTKLSHYKSYGKWYIEFNINSLASGTSAIGFSNTIESINNSLGDTINSWGLWNNGDLKTNNTVIANVPQLSFTTNDIIGIAFDLINGNVWFSKNGSFAPGSNPATNTNPQFSLISGKIKPSLSPNSIGNSLSIITDPSNFTYIVPSGFISGYYFPSSYKKFMYYKKLNWSLVNNTYIPPTYTSIQWQIK